VSVTEWGSSEQCFALDIHIATVAAGTPAVGAHSFADNSGTESKPVGKALFDWLATLTDWAPFWYCAGVVSSKPDHVRKCYRACSKGRWSCSCHIGIRGRTLMR
jgi:hypothetical protein